MSTPPVFARLSPFRTFSFTSMNLSEAARRASFLMTRRATKAQASGAPLAWPASLLLRERGQNAGTGRLNNGSSAQSVARQTPEVPLIGRNQS